ncbi:hypothetical protein ACQP2K_44180 [Microbispora siamensis]
MKRSSRSRDRGSTTSLGLMALSALGIGVHTVFNLQQVALTMDGVRGAKALIGCLLAGTPLALTCQAALIACRGWPAGWWSSP